MKREEGEGKEGDRDRKKEKRKSKSKRKKEKERERKFPKGLCLSHSLSPSIQSMSLLTPAYATKSAVPSSESSRLRQLYLSG